MTTTVFVTLEHMTCGSCGVLFGMAADHVHALRQTHETFYCPRGCRRYFAGETDVERLAREKRETESRLKLAWESRDREQQRRFQVERRLQAQKGATTRLKRRAAAGTCPCCKRTFQSLTRHMQHQHPEFVAKAKVEG